MMNYRKITLRNSTKGIVYMNDLN